MHSLYPYAVASIKPGFVSLLEPHAWEFGISTQSEIPLDASQQRHKAVSSLAVKASCWLDEIKRKLFISLHKSCMSPYSLYLLAGKLSKYFNGGERRGRIVIVGKKGGKKLSLGRKNHTKEVNVLTVNYMSLACD